MGNSNKNHKLSAPVKYQPKEFNKATTYSKEEIDLIDSMSIEEAYQRGLI